MQAGQPGADGVEVPAGVAAPHVATGGDEEEVAGPDGDALGPLGRFEVGDGDGHLGVEERDVALGGHVEQHASADQAVAHAHHRVGPGAVAAELRRRAAAVHLAPHEHVRQGVDVGEAEPVDLGADEVGAGLVAGQALGVEGVAGGEHVVLGRERRLHRRLEGQVVGEAPGRATGDQGGGPGPVGVGLVVERAPLVAAAPAVPVAEPVVEPVELTARRLGDRRPLLCCDRVCHCAFQPRLTPTLRSGRLTSVSLPEGAS